MTKLVSTHPPIVTAKHLNQLVSKAFLGTGQISKAGWDFKFRSQHNLPLEAKCETEDEGEYLRFRYSWYETDIQ